MRGRSSIFVAIATTALVCCMALFSFGCGKEPATPTSTQPAATSSTAPIDVETATTAADATTVTASADSAGLASYADPQGRFTIEYPAAWERTSLALLGDTDVYGLEAVGFADQLGPTTDDDCYTNFIQVNIDENGAYDESSLALLRDNLPKTLERLGAKHDAVTVVETWRQREIAGVPGMTLVLETSDNGKTIRGLDCVLVVGHRFYEIELVTREEDWEQYKPIFQEIIGSFTTDAS
jgi:hypothetical protein